MRQQAKGDDTLLLDRRYGMALILLAALVTVATLLLGYARLPGKRVPDKAQLVYGEEGIHWGR